MSARDVMPIEAQIMESFHYDPGTGVVTRLKADKYGKRFEGKPCGSINGNGYYITRLNGRSLKLHRIAFVLMTGRMPNGFIDHINGIRTDNCWENLRECTNAQNSQNRRSEVKSQAGFRGIRPTYNGKWEVKVKANNRSYELGTFATLEEAISVRLEAVRKLHGEFSGRQTNEEANSQEGK